MVCLLVEVVESQSLRSRYKKCYSTSYNDPTFYRRISFYCTPESFGIITDSYIVTFESAYLHNCGKHDHMWWGINTRVIPFINCNFIVNVHRGTSVCVRNCWHTHEGSIFCDVEPHSKCGRIVNFWFGHNLWGNDLLMFLL